MNNNLLFNNVFLFLKVVSKQHASYSTKNNYRKNKSITEKMLNEVKSACGGWVGTVRSHAGIGG